MSAHEETEKELRNLEQKYEVAEKKINELREDKSEVRVLTCFLVFVSEFSRICRHFMSVRQAQPRYFDEEFSTKCHAHCLSFCSFNTLMKIVGFLQNRIMPVFQAT